MSFLSTALYTVSTPQEAEQFISMAPGMTAGYEQQPGFERLVVARDVMDPLTIVTMSWWESQEAADAWTRSQGYRDVGIPPGSAPATQHPVNNPSADAERRHLRLVK